MSTRILASLVSSLFAAAPLAAQDCTLTNSFGISSSPYVKGAQLGGDVDVSGDVLVGGAPYEDHSGATKAGAAYVWGFDGTQWVQEARFALASVADWDTFGEVVTVSGDTAVVGSDNVGASGWLQIHRRSGTSWSLEDEFGPVGNDFVLEGDRLAVHAPGGVFVYERTGTTWAQAGSLPMVGVVQELALSGDTIAVGVANQVQVHVKDGASWSSQATIAGPVGVEFGYSVALDGDTLLVGARDEPGGGAAYVYERTSGSWGPALRLEGSTVVDTDSFGHAVALHQDRAYVSAYLDDVPYNGAGGGLSFNSGSVFEFVRTGGTWVETARMFADDALNQDRLGGSLAHDGGWMVAGAASGDPGPGGMNAGEIYAFDPTIPCALRYCTAGTSASGCQATLTPIGIPSATAPDGFDVLADDVEGAKDGIFFYGTGGQVANPWGNSTSFKCVPLPSRRSNLKTGNGTAGACDGFFKFDVNKQFTAVPAHNPGAGAVMQLQLWYRDPLNTSNQTTSLSDALEFTVEP